MRHNIGHSTLESAESLYQSSDFLRSKQILKKYFSWSGRLLSKCTKHEEDCANFFLRESEFYVLVWSSAYYLIKKCKNLTEIMQLMMKLGYSFSRQFSAKFVVNNIEIYSEQDKG